MTVTLPLQVDVFNGRLSPSGVLAPRGPPGETLWNYGAGAPQAALFPVHGFGGQKHIVLSTTSFLGAAAAVIHIYMCACVYIRVCVHMCVSRV